MTSERTFLHFPNRTTSFLMESNQGLSSPRTPFKIVDIKKPRPEKEDCEKKSLHVTCFVLVSARSRQFQPTSILYQHTSLPRPQISKHVFIIQSFHYTRARHAGIRPAPCERIPRSHGQHYYDTRRSTTQRDARHENELTEK